MNSKSESQGANQMSHANAMFRKWKEDIQMSWLSEAVIACHRNVSHVQLNGMAIERSDQVKQADDFRVVEYLYTCATEKAEFHDP
jgi:hypothetical protein